MPESPANSAVDAAAAAAARAHPPLVEHLVAVPGAQRELAQLLGVAGGQHEVAPADRGLDAAGEPFEADGVLRAGTRARGRSR